MINYTFSLTTFEYFILILMRVTSFLYVAPFFSNRGVPARTKIGLAACISILLMTVVPMTEAEYETAIGYGVIVVIEVITGLMMGFCANMITYIISFAGHIIDMDIGLSMAQEYNAEMASEITVSGNFYYYSVMLLLVITDMYQYLIRAVVQSFVLIPLGGAKFDMDALLASMITFCSDLILISFQIMLPVFACIMILNCVLGIMAKVAPQMNMFAVGMQLKVLVGFAVIFLTIFLLPNIANFLYKETRVMLTSIIEGMY